MDKKIIDKIKWLGHASFLIEDQKILCIDPWKISGDFLADFILITHDHYDHYSVDDVRKIAKESSHIIAPFVVQDSLPGEHHLIAPGESISIDKFTINAVCAYNINKPFHPRSNGWVGYVVTLPGGGRIYHTGDSDVIPEQKSINTDVILVPVGGTYTMDAEAAARLVNEIKPEYAVPMHFGEIVGGMRDAERFKSLVQGNVIILPPQK